MGNVIICSDNKCISEKELEAILDSFSFLKDKPKIFYFGTSEKINKKIRRKDIGHHTFIHNATIKELGTSWNEKGCPLIAAMHSIYLKNYEKHKNEEISWKESGLQINEYLKNKTVQIAENEEKNECDLNVYIVPKQKKKKKKKGKMINDDMMKQPLHKKKSKNKMNEEAIKKWKKLLNGKSNKTELLKKRLRKKEKEENAKKGGMRKKCDILDNMKNAENIEEEEVFSLDTKHENVQSLFSMGFGSNLIKKAWRSLKKDIKTKGIQPEHELFILRMQEKVHQIQADQY